MLVYPRFHGLDQLNGVPHLFFHDFNLREWVKQDLNRNCRSNEYTTYKYASVCGYAWLHYDGDVIKLYAQKKDRYLLASNVDLGIEVKIWQ